jgi:hypothetical protein
MLGGLGTPSIMAFEALVQIFARAGIVTACRFTFQDVYVIHGSDDEEKSGRHDSNMRPPAPKAGALARLSYAPSYDS